MFDDVNEYFLESMALLIAGAAAGLGQDGGKGILILSGGGKLWVWGP